MEFKDTINNRRAINFFDPEQKVPDNLLKEMIEMAAKAPSSFNLQPWNLIVLKDPEEKKNLMNTLPVTSGYYMQMMQVFLNKKQVDVKKQSVHIHELDKKTVNKLKSLGYLK